MIAATPANMREFYADGVFAYSPRTGEEYSANPGDYWDLPDDEPLRDAQGNAMVLASAQRVITILEANA